MGPGLLVRELAARPISELRLRISEGLTQAESEMLGGGTHRHTGSLPEISESANLSRDKLSLGAAKWVPSTWVPKMAFMRHGQHP